MDFPTITKETLRAQSMITICSIFRLGNNPISNVFYTGSNQRNEMT